MTQDIKLCINCKHSLGKYNKIYECHHPQSDGWIISPVDGKISWNPDSIWRGYCESARSVGRPCGTTGKYFEQKEEKLSLMSRFLNFIKNGPLG
jgi:hypothetical protein